MEIGHDDADVGLIAGRHKKVRERPGGDVRDRPRPHLLRAEVVEVGRHLVLNVLSHSPRVGCYYWDTRLLGFVNYQR